MLYKKHPKPLPDFEKIAFYFSKTFFVDEKTFLEKKLVHNFDVKNCKESISDVFRAILNILRARLPKHGRQPPLAPVLFVKPVEIIRFLHFHYFVGNYLKLIISDHYLIISTVIISNGNYLTPCNYLISIVIIST